MILLYILLVSAQFTSGVLRLLWIAYQIGVGCEVVRGCALLLPLLVIIVDLN